MKITNIVVLRVNCVGVLCRHSNFLLIKNLLEDFNVKQIRCNAFLKVHPVFMLRSEVVQELCHCEMS